MNRPTDDVDDLLDMAEEAMAASDFPEAVMILRKAASVAPLRKDIRNRLAMALEGTPIPRRTNRNRVPVETPVAAPTEQYGTYGSFEDEPEDMPIVDGATSGGSEAIGQIAKKAFENAANTTARAGAGARNLTNLLQQGIQTWKSSLADQVKAAKPAARAALTVEDPELSVSHSTNSAVFTPEADLKKYLDQAEPESDKPKSNRIETEDDAEETARIIRREPVSKKRSQSGATKKTASRQRDMEDVVAAGIDGFIEAVGKADRKKIAYTIVYLFLGGIFAFACFDVSKKFPAVQAIPGSQVQSASLGSLNLAEVQSSDEAIAQAKNLVDTGKASQATELLETHLESGRFLKNRDKIRIELATIYNDQAEKLLIQNRLADSVSMYKKALKVLPADAALQLRLANALYYQGTLGNDNSETKKSSLSDAVRVLDQLVSRNGDNLQAHRLLALVQSALGEKNLAKASWLKVKSMAPSDSAESKEAASHLK